MGRGIEHFTGLQCKQIKGKTMKQKNYKTIYIFQELPEVAEKLTPTLIEIRKDVQGDKKISDKQFTKWGKSLVQKGRPFAK